jgi:ribosomal protein S8
LFKKNYKIFRKLNLILIDYIGDFEIVDDRRGGKIVVELLGRLNKCGVISPRFDVKVTEYEKVVGNLLPSRQFGYIVLTTTYVRKINSVILFFF